MQVMAKHIMLCECVLKVAYTRIVLQTHVLALNNKTNFTFVGLSVFTFDFVLKPWGEDFILRGEGGAKNFDPALSTVETIYLGFSATSHVGGREWASEHLVDVLRILHATCIVCRCFLRMILICVLVQKGWIELRGFQARWRDRLSVEACPFVLSV